MLTLSIIFLLSVFVVVQFYLQQEVQGKSAALERLNAQITGLAEQLSMAKSDKADLESQLAGCRPRSRAHRATATNSRPSTVAQPLMRQRRKESQRAIR